jgi:hypothetical protein
MWLAVNDDIWFSGIGAGEPHAPFLFVWLQVFEVLVNSIAYILSDEGIIQWAFCQN